MNDYHARAEDVALPERFTTADGHDVEVTRHPDAGLPGVAPDAQLVRVTPRDPDRYDPLAPFTDDDGVPHVFSHARADWYHADHRYPYCRDPSCAGNQHLLRPPPLYLTGTTVHGPAHPLRGYLQLTLRLAPDVDLQDAYARLAEAIEAVARDLRVAQQPLDDAPPGVPGTEP